jgi:uncharacterized membrane protein
MLRYIALAAGALMMMGVTALPAHAELKLCNKTNSRVAAALGYKDQQGWVTEGWWTVPAQQCVTLVKTPLNARYYYVFALDYDEGGSWGGNSMMCTRDRVFTIRGIQDCEKRGYRKTGFREIDTGEKTDHIIELSGDKTTQGQ